VGRRRFTPRLVEQTTRTGKALELRRKGWTYMQIAVNLGISEASAANLVRTGMRAAAQLGERQAELLRNEEAEHLTKLWQVALPRALEGDPKWYDRALRTRESYRKLLGLDLAGEAAVIDARRQTVILSTRDLDLAAGFGDDPQTVAALEQFGRAFAEAERRGPAPAVEPEGG
jgi:hypothetical protein